MEDLTMPGLPGAAANSSGHEPLTVTSTYNKFSDTFRRHAPPQLQCTVFCGGKRCKYEGPGSWASEQCAVTGLYSTWITEEILAMCRLNTSSIQDYDIIGQFQTLGIKSVINLQVPGEHESCSPVPLHPSGFSYDPAALMDAGIYFYNYGWRDYGDASLAHLLDMVKVLSFSVSEGKVAIHCHAGLGRTGVLIASYLVFANRLRANDAVRLVRAKRPGSISSRLHILCVQQFEQFILPNSVIFCNRDLLKDKKIQDFTLQQYLKRQKLILHGRELKSIRHIPKILHTILERLLTLAGQPNVIPPEEPTSPQEDSTPPTLAGTPDTIGSPVSSPTSTLMSPIQPDPDSSSSTSNSSPTYSVSQVVRAFLSDHVNMVEGLSRYVRQYRVELNQKGMGAWVRLSHEKNLYVLTALFLLWLEHLRTPLLGSEELTTVVLIAADVRATLSRLPMEVSFVLDYILAFVANLRLVEGEWEEDGVLRRLAASFTHRIVPSTERVKIHAGFHVHNAEKGKPRVLSEGTLSKLMLFLQGLLTMKRMGVPLAAQIELKVTPTSAQTQ